VHTLAGSGAAGLRGGAATDAQFMMPMGVAVGGPQVLFVADAAAQRIYELRDGVVQTIAGSGVAAVGGAHVAGGYRDGIASLAQFNHPSAIAIGHDGIYVADMANHCIRVVSDGRVTTYAGSPLHLGGADGDRRAASFAYPRALVFEHGDLFVADDSVGVRKIDVAGKVSTLHLPETFGRRVLSLTFVGSGETRRLVVGSIHGFLALNSSFSVVWTRSVDAPTTAAIFDANGAFIENSLKYYHDSAGIPFAMVDVGPNLIAYTDPSTHAVRFLDTSATSGPVTALTKVSLDAAYGGGYRDGQATQALFDFPLGLARYDNGTLVIADAGNRRIRTVTGAFPTTTHSGASFEGLRIPATPRDGPGRKVNLAITRLPKFDSNAYRIAYLGNSFSFFNTRWDESIPGILERHLYNDAHRLHLKKRVEVAAVYILPTLQATKSYVEAVLTKDLVDCVVMQLNWITVAESFPAGMVTASGQPYRTEVGSQAAALMREIYGTLHDRGIPAVVVVHPMPWEFSPVEQLVSIENVGWRDNQYSSLGFGFSDPPTTTDPVLRILRAADVPIIDLTRDFRDAEKSTQRVALFGSNDYHFTAAGRRFVADRVADQLELSKPWNHLTDRIARRPIIGSARLDIREARKTVKSYRKRWERTMEKYAWFASRVIAR